MLCVIMGKNMCAWQKKRKYEKIKAKIFLLSKTFCVILIFFFISFFLHFIIGKSIRTANWISHNIEHVGGMKKKQRKKKKKFQGNWIKIQKEELLEAGRGI